MDSVFDSWKLNARLAQLKFEEINNLNDIIRKWEEMPIPDRILQATAHVMYEFNFTDITDYSKAQEIVQYADGELFPLPKFFERLEHWKALHTFKELK